MSGGGTDSLNTTLADNTVSVLAQFEIGANSMLVKAGPGTLTVVASAKPT
jgi:hypothetical protein